LRTTIHAFRFCSRSDVTISAAGEDLMSFEIGETVKVRRFGAAEIAV
jgi:hypothetical protein